MLVLFIVSSLMAMQGDVGVQVRSARRAVTSAHNGAARPARLAAGGTGLLFVLLALPAMMPAVLPASFTAIAPTTGMGTSMAIGMFLAATAVWLLLIYIALALMMMLRRTKRA